MTEELDRLIAGIGPYDDTERAAIAEATRWVRSGAPVHRIRKPDVPPRHLVSYIVVLSPGGELLLVEHRKAGLWLPAGGHVEPGESPWETVLRECAEELHVRAVPSGISGDRPFFLSIARTRGEGAHTDVSLWYVVTTAAPVTSFDESEFGSVRWLSPTAVMALPPSTLDPNMHRFTAKLVRAGR
ncbi:MAG: NUDIX domain-containing protein [Streptosporangiales bacterium]|nr:NUDIX domain-containing protein [Streptosporangiales bacterium]